MREMVYCSRCGDEVPETAMFCLKCGVMTSKGEEAGVSYPWNWEKELEKTISNVSTEIEKAFTSVRENVRRTIKKDPIDCLNCGETNRANSKFCYQCGKKMS
jgi:uncharacterized membrane protein YvbJ